MSRLFFLRSFCQRRVAPGLLLGSLLAQGLTLALVLALVLFFASSPVFATSLGQSDEPASLSSVLSAEVAVSRLLRFSGVGAQLAQLEQQVADETEGRMVDCANSEVETDRRLHLLQKTLSAASLVSSLEAHLHNELDRETRSAALSWYASDAGNTVHRLDAASGEMSEAEFNSTLDSYTGSSAWSEARQSSIGSLLESTRTVEFVTTYNTGSLALAIIASTCVDRTSLAGTSGSAENAEIKADFFEKQLQTNRKIVDAFDWSDDMVAHFIRLELLPVSGMFYRELSDLELQLYLDFAKSEKGRRFFSALITATRLTMQSAVVALSHRMQSIQSDSKKPTQVSEYK